VIVVVPGVQEQLGRGGDEREGVLAGLGALLVEGEKRITVVESEAVLDCVVVRRKTGQAGAADRNGAPVGVLAPEDVVADLVDIETCPECGGKLRRRTPGWRSARWRLWCG
jgi:hypothetical protein